MSSETEIKEWNNRSEVEKLGFVYPEIKVSEARPDYILGVQPDAPVCENDRGGKQSESPYAFHLLPMSALFDAAKVAAYGAKKYGESFGDRNYLKITCEEHLNHAAQHLFAFLAGDKSDDHLGHAIVRLMFAYDCNEKGIRENGV